MTNDYTPPKVWTLGTVEGLTKQQYNKIGSQADVYTEATEGEVVGSLVPVSK